MAGSGSWLAATSSADARNYITSGRTNAITRYSVKQSRMALGSFPSSYHLETYGKILNVAKKKKRVKIIRKNWTVLGNLIRKLVAVNDELQGKMHLRLVANHQKLPVSVLHLF